VALDDDGLVFGPNEQNKKVEGWWEQRDLNPPQRISSETAHQMGSLQDCNRSALQLVINFSKPTRRHSRATGARDTTKLYYTPVCIQP
jgi:hypothetical protein